MPQGIPPITYHPIWRGVEQPKSAGIEDGKLNETAKRALAKRVGQIAAEHFANNPNEELQSAMLNGTREQYRDFANQQGYFRPADPDGEWTLEDFSRKGGKSGELAPNKRFVNEQILSHGHGDAFVEHVNGAKAAAAKHPSGGFPATIAELPQGGHAGGGVSSIEELRRPGQNYVIRGTTLTYHGKAFDPGSTPAGSTHLNVRPDGSYLVNSGPGLTPAQERALTKAVGQTVYRIFDAGGNVN
jgi:hypothetical protein